MHHKRLLSGPFRAGARRSPCLQTPLCPPRLLGPGRSGLQPQSTPARGNPNTCALRGRRGGDGEVGPPGPPQARPPPPSPPLVHRAQRVERIGCAVLRRWRKSNDKARWDTRSPPRARRPPHGKGITRCVPPPGAARGGMTLPGPGAAKGPARWGAIPDRRAQPSEGQVGLGAVVPVVWVTR